MTMNDDPARPIEPYAARSLDIVHLSLLFAHRVPYGSCFMISRISLWLPDMKGCYSQYTGRCVTIHVFLFHQDLVVKDVKTTFMSNQTVTAKERSMSPQGTNGENGILEQKGNFFFTGTDDSSRVHSSSLL